MRYFAFLRYRGANYNGIQKQFQNHTIQDEIDCSLMKLFKKEIKTIIGSRTDTGVHAYKNCIHFDLGFDIDCENIKRGLNKILPEDISILEIRKTKDYAHSRFSAVKRRYRYVISKEKDPFNIGYCYNKFDLLDVDKMDFVLKMLLGETSFKTFSKENKFEKHNYKCIIYDIFCKKNNSKIYFEIEGNRFTHSLIRCLVFNIVNVGLGKFSVDDFLNRLKSTDKALKIGVFPPDGLILLDVQYKNEIFI